MIRICERCYGHVADHEPHVELAHVDHALADGSVVWNHSHVHTVPCAAAGTGRSPVEVPDRGDWDERRRGLSPAASAHIARRTERVAPRA
ncbi:MAG: hypothetical protein J0I34_22350 [Pseudonocardia sp.]|uniref:hypothetical protein n=1 Tax=unclassified Pseudonocardia TaxID=2619320 RepID=UPI00086CBE22|nr:MULTISPECIES: hypothetical protein [unclassified Pseudonocardia]MBN9111512.1 hypothetical protein [Pseudonocardia sp.]ODU23334.1 MAG: hypothetical protein ABS80_15305 [Pseudonocardia sp. SCN 72-51]ODV02753.1 MAG: hypothetical protein ABT15_24490 [Pseudonocardia sp. SCN 73-27]